MRPEEILRERRARECFPVVNRGELWYRMLSYEQRAELADWYIKWLNAPETLVAPPAPAWLRDKLVEKEELV